MDWNRISKIFKKKNITHNKNTIVFQEWSQSIIFPSTAFYISKLFFKLTLNSNIMDTLNTQTNLPELEQELSTWLNENGYRSLRAARICTEYTHLQAKDLWHDQTLQRDLLTKEISSSLLINYVSVQKMSFWRKKSNDNKIFKGVLRYITKLTKLLIVGKFVINLEVHHTALLNDRYSIINCCFGFICQQMHVHVFSYISCTKKREISYRGPRKRKYILFRIFVNA